MLEIMGRRGYLVCGFWVGHIMLELFNKECLRFLGFYEFFEEFVERNIVFVDGS